jgi:hypothetical protein
VDTHGQDRAWPHAAKVAAAQGWDLPRFSAATLALLAFCAVAGLN